MEGLTLVKVLLTSYQVITFSEPEFFCQYYLRYFLDEWGLHQSKEAVLAPDEKQGCFGLKKRNVGII